MPLEISPGLTLNHKSKYKALDPFLFLQFNHVHSFRTTVRLLNIYFWAVTARPTRKEDFLWQKFSTFFINTVGRQCSEPLMCTKELKLNRQMSFKSLIQVDTFSVKGALCNFLNSSLQEIKLVLNTLRFTLNIAHSCYCYLYWRIVHFLYICFLNIFFIRLFCI